MAHSKKNSVGLCRSQKGTIQCYRFVSWCRPVEVHSESTETVAGQPGHFHSQKQDGLGRITRSACSESYTRTCSMSARMFWSFYHYNSFVCSIGWMKEVKEDVSDVALTPDGPGPSGLDKLLHIHTSMESCIHTKLFFLIKDT